MSYYVWNGDGVQELDGVKAKSQIIILPGGYTAYYVDGDATTMENHAKGGNDLIVGDQSAYLNDFYGDAKQMDDSIGGNDRLIGSESAFNNRMCGDADNLNASKGGNDVLIGGTNARYNDLFGDARAILGIQDQLSYGGNDVLVAGAENSENYLYGDGGVIVNAVCGNDLLLGGDTNTRNYLYGDGSYGGVNVWAGNDRLVSGTGVDLMWGDVESYLGVNMNFGHDTFVFKGNNGTDTIYDFRSGDDKIELSGIAGIDDFSDVQISESGGNSVITLGTDDTVTIVGVTSLQAQDFVFS